MQREVCSEKRPTRTRVRSRSPDSAQVALGIAVVQRKLHRGHDGSGFRHERENLQAAGRPGGRRRVHRTIGRCPFAGPVERTTIIQRAEWARRCTLFLPPAVQHPREPRSKVGVPRENAARRATRRTGPGGPSQTEGRRNIDVLVGARRPGQPRRSPTPMYRSGGRHARLGRRGLEPGRLRRQGPAAHRCRKSRSCVPVRPSSACSRR